MLVRILFLVVPFLIGCAKEKETQSVLRYGQHERQVMTYQLTGETCCLFVHGGAWVSGDMSDWEYIKPLIKSRGYSYAAMNYRFLPATSDSMLEDITNAIAALKSMGIKRVWLVGQSAGTNIVLNYASKNRVEGVICVATISNTNDWLCSKLLGVARTYGDVNVSDHKFDCPVTLIHYKDDTIVHYKQSEVMVGNGAKLITLQGDLHCPPSQVTEDLLFQIIR
jgi:acetyl esterase/lipase